MFLCISISGVPFRTASSSSQCGTRHLSLPISAELRGFQVAKFTSARRQISRDARDCDGLVRHRCELRGRKKLMETTVRFRIHCQVGEGSNLTVEDWTKKLPAKRKALYSHSLPCIEAWLQSLGFVQDEEDRAVWNIERPDWHAQLSLDVTDLYIRYLRKGPGSLERDIERKFSYALSREDLENAILGGP